MLLTLEDLTDTKRSNMKISTFDAVQTVTYVLRSRGKTGIGMFKRDDINMRPVDKTLCQNTLAAGRRDKTDREKRTEAKQKRQAEYGCSATCESAEKAKTTALAKERQTHLHLVISQTLLFKETYKRENSQAKSNKKNMV